MSWAFARRDIEKLYMDTCTVMEKQHVKDPNTGITSLQDVTVHKNIPGKLSHKKMAYSEGGIASVLSLTSSLIINPDIVIKPGSKILVTRNGITTAYKNSGEPGRYMTHQEIMLELEDEHA